jgi:hypothetical protein
MFLSEITSADGLSLSRDAWNGTQTRYSPLLWPFQPSPGPKSWVIWRRLLASTFLASIPKRTSTKTKDLELLQPLGSWLPDSEWIFPKWPYRYSPSSDRVYHHADHQYGLHLPRRRSRKRSQLFGAKVASSSFLAFRGVQVSRTSALPALLPTTFEDYIHQLPCWDKRLLQDVTILDEIALIEYLLSDEALFVVSNGGAAEALGSFGALLASQDVIFVKISGSTEGALPGSFRAESYGCLAILRFLYHFQLFNYLEPIQCRNTFYCYNKGLIQRLSFAHAPLTPFPRHYLRSDIYLEMQIVDTIRLLHITLDYRHVKGHQDEGTTSEVPLTREAMLNVQCDELATAALTNASPSPLVQFLPASAVSVTVDGQTLNRKLPKAIRTSVGRRRQLASFGRRYSWTAAQFDQLDWPLFCFTTYKFSLKKRFFVIKWLNDLLPFQSRMHKLGQLSMAGCPDECGCESETHQRLLHCTATPRVDLFAVLTPDLDTICSSHKVDPFLRKVLLTIVSPYFGEDLHLALPADYARLLTFQQELHLDSLFIGCVSLEWARLQMIYLKLNNYPRTKDQVAAALGALLSYLLDFAYPVWLQRNTVLHGDDSTTKLLSYSHTQLLLDIQDLYDQSDSMLAADRSLFTKPYDYWITQPTTQLLTFLKRMKPTVKVSVAQAADMGANFRSIDSYSPPLVPAHLFDLILGTPYIPADPDVPAEPG